MSSAESITSMIAQAWSLPDSYTLTVADQHDVGGRSVTIGVASTTTYWRILLASSASPTSCSTTAGTYKDFLAHLQAELNAGTGGGNYYTVSLLKSGTNAGFIQIAYSGTGTATITLEANPSRIGVMLGFANHILTITSGGTIVGDLRPNFVCYFIGRARANSGRPVLPWTIGGRRQDGVVYCMQGTAGFIQYTFDARFHPKDDTTRTTYGYLATPKLGDVKRRYTSGASINPQPTGMLVPPWGMNDFVQSAGGLPAAAVFSTFQTFTPGDTVSTVYLDYPMLTGSTTVPSIPNTDDRYDWPGWTLNETGTETT